MFKYLISLINVINIKKKYLKSFSSTYLKESIITLFLAVYLIGQAKCKWIRAYVSITYPLINTVSSSQTSHVNLTVYLEWG